MQILQFCLFSGLFLDIWQISLNVEVVIIELEYNQMYRNENLGVIIRFNKCTFTYIIRNITRLLTCHTIV